MFLNLDKKDRSKIAVIDDSKQSVTYGYLCDFATEFKNHLPERTLTFILAENTIGSLLGYFVNPAKRKAMAVKNEKRFLKQKRNALKNPGYSRHPVNKKASFKRLLKAV